MKTGAAAINAHIQLTTTSLADCVRIDRKDGTQLGFTSHDVDITYDGLTYKAETAITRTNFEAKDNLSVANLDIQGLIDASDITESDIRAGRYDNAEVYFFTINWANIVTDEIIKLDRGFIGDIKLRDGIYVAELRDLTQRLNKNLLRLFTPECQADFGAASTGCQFDLDTVKETGTVGTVTDNREFTLTGLTTSTEDYFNGGKVKFTSGANNGLYGEIKDFDAPNAVTLFLKMPFTVAVTDTVEIWPGCNKSRTACKAYGQIENMQGYPDLPGQDALYDYPDARA